MLISFGKTLVTLEVTTKMPKTSRQCMSLMETEFHYFHLPVFGYCPVALVVKVTTSCISVHIPVTP